MTDAPRDPLLPPATEAMRQRLLYLVSPEVQKAALEKKLNTSFSQEEYDYLVNLVAQARAAMEAQERDKRWDAVPEFFDFPSNAPDDDEGEDIY